MTPPTGPAVSFTYDPLGNMLTATRGGATVTLAYDTAGRKLSMNDPDMGNWSYSYDALGLMTSQIDARSCTTNLNYDLLGRPIQKSYSGCPATLPVTYRYDETTYPNGIGRRTSMEDGSGSAEWKYDSRGRLVKETKTISGQAFITEWGYNSADLPTWMKYPDSEIVNYTYDSRMLLDTVIGTNTYVFDTQYDSAGRMTSRELGNGITQSYEYYPWNQQGGRLQNLTSTRVAEPYILVRLN